MTADTPTSGVTVCICTFNRADLLQGTLAQFVKLRVAPTTIWELIVVNNASTDRTADVLKEFEPRLPMRIVFESTQGLSHARNRALVEARFPWILFTDDDVQIGENWLEAFVAAVGRHPEASVAGGPIEPWFPMPADPLLSDVFPELRHGFCGLDYGLPEGLLARHQDVFGANFALRRDRMGSLLFDPTLGLPHRLNEETELIGQIRKGGGSVLWIPDMRVRHYVDPSRMTLSYLRRYRVYQGATQVTLEGLEPAATLFGMPRWLMGKWLGAYMRGMGHRLAGRKRESLLALREYCFYEGMLREARTQRTRPPTN